MLIRVDWLIWIHVLYCHIRGWNPKHTCDQVLQNLKLNKSINLNGFLKKDFDISNMFIFSTFFCFIFQITCNDDEEESIKCIKNGNFKIDNPIAARNLTGEKEKAEFKCSGKWFHDAAFSNFLIFFLDFCHETAGCEYWQLEKLSEKG